LCRYATALKEVKNLAEVLDSITDGIDWALTQLIGPAPPSVEQLVAAAAAEKAAQEKAEEKAASKAAAEAEGKYWEDPDAEAEEAAAAAEAEAAEEAARKAAEPIEGAELIPKTLTTLVVSMWGFVRATIESNGDMKDDDLLQMLQICRRAADADPAIIAENTVYAAVGCLASLAEDKPHCERLLVFGKRPETPPPFTEKELEEHAREEFRCRSRGIKFVNPTREKPQWDPTKSVMETTKSCLAPDDGDEGRTRTMATVVAGLLLQHTHAEDARGEDALEGPYREMLGEDTSMVDGLLEAIEKGAMNEHFKKPLHGGAAQVELS
jgi:hypothetical protein